MNFAQLSPEDQVLVTKQVREELQGDYAKRFEAEMTKQKEANTVAIQTALEEMRKRMTPPTATEIEDTLNQEYATFKVQIMDGADVINFTLVELPIRIEKKFYKMIIDKVQPRLKELANFEGDKIFEGDIETKASQLIQLLDPTMELLCDLTALILDPFERQKEKITGEWVATTIPSWRIWNIVMAQININRVRDFFSTVFQGSSNGQMILKAVSLQ